MSEHHTHLSTLDVDEAWIVGWADEGIAALELYLAKHAAFADFLRVRNGLDWIDGDGSPDA
jgi:predicted nucleic-acid-binding protein